MQQYNQIPNQTLVGGVEVDNRWKNGPFNPDGLSLKQSKNVISERFEVLDKVIAMNKELLLQVQSRLQAVLAPVPPPNPMVAKDTSSPILMVAHLENLCEATEINNQILRNILANLGL